MQNALPMIVRSLVVSLIAYSFLGCDAKSRPIQDDVRDPLVYAGSVKSRVISYLNRIKKNPSMAQAQMGYLVEFVQTSNAPSAPVGSDRETFQRLSQACQELADIYNGASQGNKEAKTKEVMAIANELPGVLDPGDFD